MVHVLSVNVGYSKNAPSDSARAHNRESTMGSFEGRVWKQKCQNFVWLLRWAYNLRGSMSPELVSKWVLQKATDRYLKWRNSDDFLAMLHSVKLNTKRFWQLHSPNMDPKELHERVSLQFPHSPRVVCSAVNLFCSLCVLP